MWGQTDCLLRQYHCSCDAKGLWDSVFCLPWRAAMLKCYWPILATLPCIFFNPLQSRVAQIHVSTGLHMTSCVQPLFKKSWDTNYRYIKRNCVFTIMQPSYDLFSTVCVSLLLWSGRHKWLQTWGIPLPSLCLFLIPRSNEPLEAGWCVLGLRPPVTHTHALSHSDRITPVIYTNESVLMTLTSSLLLASRLTFGRDGKWLLLYGSTLCRHLHHCLHHHILCWGPTKQRHQQHHGIKLRLPPAEETKEGISGHLRIPL